MTNARTDINALLARGMDAHRAGRLDEAESAYSSMLRMHHNHPDALHLLGQIERQRRRPEAALALVERALAVHDSPAYLNTLGSILSELNRPSEAIHAFDRALKAQPGFGGALYNRANALKKLDRLDQAVTDYARVIEQRPDFADALHNMGGTLVKLGRFTEALEMLRRADAVRPDDADTQVSLGAALLGLEQAGEALACFERALALAPGQIDARIGQAGCWHVLGEGARAEQAYRELVTLKPDYAPVRLAFANRLLKSGREEEALVHYDRLIGADSELAEARFNRGVLLLRRGDWRRGWEDFEYRLKLPNLTRTIGLAETGLPQWLGEMPSGRTILVMAEQGLGDTIHFLRFLPQLAERGAKPLFLPQGALLSLLGDCQLGFELVASVDQAKRRGAQSWVSLLSLPHRLGADGQDIGQRAAYLRAQPARVGAWRDWLAARAGAKLKVGVAWRGRAEYAMDKFRSFPVDALLPLAALDGVSLISLQKDDDGAKPDWLSEPPIGFDDDGPFLDSVGMMVSLDLVISADTAVAHLAGAAARPVWVALDKVGDWRWPLDADVSPWYPTARIFRQTVRGEWANVFAKIAFELTKLRPR